MRQRAQKREKISCATFIGWEVQNNRTASRNRTFLGKLKNTGRPNPTSSKASARFCNATLADFSTNIRCENALGHNQRNQRDGALRLWRADLDAIASAGQIYDFRRMSLGSDAAKFPPRRSLPRAWGFDIQACPTTGEEKP